MHDNPCKRFGINSGIKTGNPANLTVFDLDCSYKIDTKESKPLRRLSGYGQERFSSPKRSQCIILREPYTPERQNEMIWINTFIIMMSG